MCLSNVAHLTDVSFNKKEKILQSVMLSSTQSQKMLVHAHTHTHFHHKHESISGLYSILLIDLLLEQLHIAFFIIVF